MKEIETSSGCDYERYFCIYKDRKEKHFEYIGADDSGTYILHITGKGKEDSFYTLERDEFLSYLETAKKERIIKEKEYLKYSGLSGEEKHTPSRKIESFETVLLHTSAMRYTHDVEITKEGDRAKVVQYSLRYTEGEDVRIPEREGECSEAEVLEILNECKVISWNGFHGAHPKGVLDGIMFRFEASVNGGTVIRADGSQNFPKKYRDFTDWLHEVLSKGKEYDN